PLGRGGGSAALYEPARGEDSDVPARSQDGGRAGTGWGARGAFRCVRAAYALSRLAVEDAAATARRRSDRPRRAPGAPRPGLAREPERGHDGGRDREDAAPLARALGR